MFKGQQARGRGVEDMGGQMVEALLKWGAITGSGTEHKNSMN